MTNRYTIVGKPTDGSRPNELNHTLAPHPCIAQEAPYEPEYTLYNGRMTPATMNHASADDMYWALRQRVILRHTGELPLEIAGPDAARLLSRVMTRDVSPMGVGRCTYQVACYDDGALINDGILIRLAQDRFWFVQADGTLYGWFRAHAIGMDVRISDPDVWVSQVQGPDSLRVLDAALDAPLDAEFRYFDAVEVSIAGQAVWITRTGFSNELGWEIYFPPDIDAMAVAERIFEAGRPHDILLTSAEVFRARRIEAGLLNAGSDFVDGATPWSVGLHHLVELELPGGEPREFVGVDALALADRRRTTYGLQVHGGIAALGRTVWLDGEQAGRVCSSAWSPFLQCGVAIVKLDQPALGPGDVVEVHTIDGVDRPATITDTPMYDTKRQIPRGLVTERPERPSTRT